MFINIKNTTECVLLAIQTPPKNSEKVRVFNQTTECLNVLNLAKKISELTGCELRFFKNPRKEDSKNDLSFVNQGLLDLGLIEVKLEDGLLNEITKIVKKYRERVDKSKVITTARWTESQEIDHVGQKNPVN